MNFTNVSILSVAHVDAPHCITSSEIENQISATTQRLGIPQNFLQKLTGIRERRVWDPGMCPSKGAVMAGEKAIKLAGIDRKEIGILINTSVCRDYLEPSTACIVHSELKMPETCINFDLSNACLGFVNGMDVIGNLIDRGQIDYGILVDAETSRPITEATIERLQADDIDDDSVRQQLASLTLGSGAAAMILCRSDLAPAPSHQFTGSVNLAATWNCHLCEGNIDYMETDTREMLIAGLSLAKRTWLKACDTFDWKPKNIDHIVSHQISKVHTDKFIKLTGINEQTIFRLYPEFGNIGPAGIPIVLSKLAELKQLESGQRLALIGIGSGLNCTMAEVIW